MASTSYGTYKVRVTQNARQTSYSIGLPPEIAMPVAGKIFSVHITEEGILLRPVVQPADIETAPVQPAPEAVALAKMFS